MSTIMRVDHLLSVSNIHAKAGCGVETAGNAADELFDTIKPVFQ